MKFVLLTSLVFSLNAFAVSTIPLFDKNHSNVGSLEVSGKKESEIANFIIENATIQNFKYVDRVEVKNNILTLFIGSYDNSDSKDTAVLSYDKNDMIEHGTNLKYSF